MHMVCLKINDVYAKILISLDAYEGSARNYAEGAGHVDLDNPKNSRICVTLE